MGGQLQCFQGFQLLPNPIHFHAAAQQSQPIPIYHLALSVMPNQATSDAKKNNVTHSCCPGALLQYIMGTTTHTKFEPWMSWVLKPLAVGVVMVLAVCKAVCKGCCPMLNLYHSASGPKWTIFCIYWWYHPKNEVTAFPGWMFHQFGHLAASMEMFIINYSTSLLTWGPFSGLT